MSGARNVVDFIDKYDQVLTKQIFTDMIKSKNNLCENLLNTRITHEQTPLIRECQFLIKNTKILLVKAQKQESILQKSGMPKSFLSAANEHLTNFKLSNDSLIKHEEVNRLIDQIWEVKTEEIKAIKNLLHNALSLYIEEHSAAWAKIRNLLTVNRALLDENILVQLIALLKNIQLELKNENFDLKSLKNADKQLEEAVVMHRLNMDHSKSLSECRHKHSVHYSKLQVCIEELEEYTRKAYTVNPAFF